MNSPLACDFAQMLALATASRYELRIPFMGRASQALAHAASEIPHVRGAG